MQEPSAPLHVAIIMDGNGRWATARGMPRTAGHKRGADAVRRVVEAAPAAGVGTLTLYAFSADNWKRPPREVALLMRLFKSHLRSETPRLIENGVRLSVIGRRDRLSLSLRTAIESAEAATAGGKTLLLRLAIDYSARDAIVATAGRAVTAARLRQDGAHGTNRMPGVAAGFGNSEEGRAALTREAFATLLAEEYGGAGGVPDVDLLIRTGGEQRLSDFLLWECAYAELAFRREMWPEFGREHLEDALADFHSRQRRFGALPAAG
ncbi:MAG: polyprenyl diphosphate synthase [Gemmatimonadaceae bacterium]